MLPALILVTAAAAQVPRPSAIEQEIANALRDFRGVCGAAAINLATGEKILVNADRRFPTASTIKIAVMIEAYAQAAEGRLSLDAPIVLREADKVGGSGVLNGLHDGLSVTFRDAIHLMIVVSDNTATNLLVTRLGTARVDDRLESLGFHDTRLFRPTFRDGHADVLPDLEREYGLGMTTPRDMAGLMALIANGRAVNAGASAAMLATLGRQQERAMIPRLLPDGAAVANKTGSDQEKQAGPDGVRRQVRADIAIVGWQGVRYVIAVYTRQVEDTRSGAENDGVTTGARISKMVFDYFTGGARRAPSEGSRAR